MLRFIGAAAVLALAAANPAFAQGNGNGGDKSRGGEHAGMNHPGGKGGEKARSNDAKDRGGKSVSGKPTPRIVERAGGNDRSAPLRGKSRAEGAREVHDVRDGDRTRVTERTVVRDIERDIRRSGWDGDGDWDGRGRAFASVPGCPPGLAKKDNGCLPPGLARQNRDRYFDYEYRPTLFGIPLRNRADYVYHDGYLVPAGGPGLSYIPLLGGALAVGQAWPQSYPSLRLADWQDDYYGFENPREYRYADNVVYRVDPETAAIQSVAALLTGNEFVVGQPMPLGYDVYNVPYDYRDRYVDSDEALYRYADGRVYQIDPATMLIAQAIDLVV